MILSICIPSYNRGFRALEAVDQFIEISKIYPGEIELIISDNGSTKSTEDYHKIAEMNIDNLVYSRNEENLGFHGNVNKLIKLSRGQFCMLLSDEDSIIIDSLSYYIDFMKSNPNIGVIRSRTNLNYNFDYEELLQPGKDLLKSFFLMNNYVSGVIYNRCYLTDEIIDAFFNAYSNNSAYILYPHMFFDTCLILCAPFYRCNKLLINEGKSEKDQVRVNDILYYGTYEARLEQMIGFCELVKDLACNDSLRLQMIMAIIQKTVFLNYLVKDKYIALGISWEDRILEMSRDLKNVIKAINIPIIDNNLDVLFEYTDALIKYEEATS